MTAGGFTTPGTFSFCGLPLPSGRGGPFVRVIPGRPIARVKDENWTDVRS